MIRLVAAAAGLLIALPACRCGAPEGGAPTDGDEAARVNGVPIPMAVFEAEVQRNLDRHRRQGNTVTPEVEFGIRLTVLDRLIDEKVLELTVKERGLDPEDKKVNAKLVEYHNRFPSETAYAEYLERTNTTADMVRAGFRHELLVDAAGTYEVSDPEVQAYYDANKASFAVSPEKPEAVRPLAEVGPEIRHLLVSRLRDAKAREVMQQAKAGLKVEMLVTIPPPPAAAPAPTP